MLSTLAILTLLFAVSTRLSLAHLQTQNTELLLAERNATRVHLLETARDLLAKDSSIRDISVQLADTVYVIKVVDAGGLVDLNTASPNLLDSYLDAIGLTIEERERFRAWRQSSKRLLRFSDLIRVSDASDSDTTLLSATATVFSGRSGVSLQEASLETQDLLAPFWQDSWATAPSNSNFELFLIKENRVKRIGVVHLRPDGTTKILSAYYR